MAWTRVNEFVANDGNEEELTTLMSDVVAYLLKRPGCEGAQLLVAEDDEARLVVIERWASKEAHQQALANYPKEKMAAARKWLAKPPRGEFYLELGAFRGAVH
jgi:heme oxygenase (mycobilin-producing)